MKVKPVGTVVRAKAPPVADAELVDIDYGRLRQISSVVQLSTITLADMAYASIGTPRELAPHVHGAGAYDLSVVDARWNRDGTLFDICIGYRIDATLPGESGVEQLFRLTARWVITYTIPEDFRFPDDVDEAVADFVLANGQLNVFPYVRQLVNDVTAKGGWPPLVLQVFKAPTKRARNLVRMMDAWSARAFVT